MAKKKFTHGMYSHEEQMRLEDELVKYLIYEDELAAEMDEDSGLRDDAPEDVKEYYKFKKWEEAELKRTGIIYD